MKFAYPSGSRPLDGYTIKRGIGVGGFGEVYFATSDAGKEVALKHIQRNLDIELRGVTQCLNLKHLNLIALYDIKYDAEGEAWVVMEYVSGESLKDVIERHPQGLPLEDVLRWFRGLAAGVNYLHEHGIVHRDLKPGNIFADDDIVKIGDYGLSKFISCSRRSGQTESVGTFHYMAPEIGRGVYGKEIDVYALGIILHEMLTGCVPFDGETSQEIIMKHLTAVPQLDGVPEPFAAVIRRALAKDPAHRYATVHEMCAAVQRAAAPQPARSAGGVVMAKAVVAREARAVPPVLATVAAAPREPIYIGDEPTAEEGMIFGPLRQSAPRFAAHQRAGRAGRAAGQRLGHAWSQTRFGAGVKVLMLLMMIAAVFMLDLDLLFPIAFFAGAGCMIYLLRAVAGPRESSRSRRELRLAAQHRAAYAARAANRQKPLAQRAYELCGTMLQASVVCALLGWIALLLAGQQFDGSLAFWSYYAWLVITATVGSWLLLAGGKVWESSDPQEHRRGWMIPAALLLGLFAYGLGEFLAVDGLHTNVDSTRAATHVQVGGWYAADGTPQLPAYLAYFLGLGIVPRWWRSVDPLRRTRVTLTSSLLVGVWAWVLHLILYFPQPAGVLIAAMMALSAQLAAPWWNVRAEESRALAA